MPPRSPWSRGADKRARRTGSAQLRHRCHDQAEGGEDPVVLPFPRDREGVCPLRVCGLRVSVVELRAEVARAGGCERQPVVGGREAIDRLGARGPTGLNEPAELPQRAYFGLTAGPRGPSRRRKWRRPNNKSGPLSYSAGPVHVVQHRGEPPRCRREPKRQHVEAIERPFPLRLARSRGRRWRSLSFQYGCRRKKCLQFSSTGCARTVGYPRVAGRPSGTCSCAGSSSHGGHCTSGCA